jgi:hypothetical protein
MSTIKRVIEARTPTILPRDFVEGVIFQGARAELDCVLSGKHLGAEKSRLLRNFLFVFTALGYTEASQSLWCPVFLGLQVCLIKGEEHWKQGGEYPGEDETSRIDEEPPFYFAIYSAFLEF